MSIEEHVDFLVLGGGPSGQKAAVQAAKAGRHVVLVDRQQEVGGECVHRGTIPSKTLRESAIYFDGLRQRTDGVLGAEIPSNLKVASLMKRLKSVMKGHEAFLSDQLLRNEIDLRHGRARFLDPNSVEISEPAGRRYRLHADVIVIATGSRPRTPDSIPVDHERILDSDSILSLIYMPKSMAVLGGGVIACEFASVFATLGVEVVMIDHHSQPLGFLDSELTERFVSALERQGCEFRAETVLESVSWDGVGSVVTKLKGGEVLRTEKLLCALGRVANVKGLDLDAAGISLTQRGHVPVDGNCQTRVPHIYAVGDVIGPPALAASAMEQGRRAARHALGLEVATGPDCLPVGIYTIPELASVGMSEADAEERFGSAVIGRSNFAELARGQITGNTEGLLKLVADPTGRQVLGAQIIGEGATELIHVAQMAILGDLTVDAFIDNMLNFPTLAEAYRVAALDIVGKRPKELRRVG